MAHSSRVEHRLVQSPQRTTSEDRDRHRSSSAEEKKDEPEPAVAVKDRAPAEAKKDEPDPAVGAKEEIERETPAASSTDEGSPSWNVPDIEASFKVPSQTPIPETAPSVLANLVTKVVEIEGPIHREEIARRITSLWGQQRTGGRIADAVSKAIDAAVHSEGTDAQSEFISVAKQTTYPVRDRSKVSSQALRKPEMLPPQELEAAIHHLVAQEVGLSSDEMQAGVSKCSVSRQPAKSWPRSSPTH